MGQNRAGAGFRCIPARRPSTFPLVEITPAILLRKTKLTETSLIVTWLTQDLGRLKTVAKGARNPKSRFAGALDLFFQCEIRFVRSSRTELHRLEDASLLESFEQVRFDYDRTSLAAYFVELIELVTEPEHAAPELHDLLSRALRHLNAAPASQRALLHYRGRTRAPARHPAALAHPRRGARAHLSPAARLAPHAAPAAGLRICAWASRLRAR